MKVIIKNLFRFTVIVTTLAVFTVVSVARDYHRTTLLQFHREAMGTVRDLGLFFRSQVLSGAIEAIPNYVEEISLDRKIVGFWMTANGADFDYGRPLGRGVAPQGKNYLPESPEIEYYDDSSKKILYVKQKIFFSEKANITGSSEEAAQLIYGFSYKSLSDQVFSVWLRLILVVISMMVFSFILFRYFRNRMSRSFNFFVANFGNIATGNLPVENLEDFDEFKPIVALGKEMAKKISEFQEKEKTNAVEIELGRLASQVSHDVRSPLAALEMILPSVTNLAEDQRVIVRNAIGRIKDIANSLLLQRKEIRQDLTMRSHALNEVHHLSPLIDSLLTEKRIQNRNKLDLVIEFSHSNANAYSVFSNVNAGDLKRVLSNLIDNSIDAFEGTGGTITVLLGLNEEGSIEIKIRDNGKGIPMKILPELMKKGVSFGKANGNGLGLFHAKEKIAEWGGKLSIKSSVESGSRGTEVVIEIPSSSAPTWFLPRLSVKAKQCIVIFDDDQTVHQIWSRRFSEVGADLIVKHLSDYTSFKKFFGANYVDLDEAIFLIDYEVGTGMDGLSIVREFGIQMQSILVTSRYEEGQVQDTCNMLGVKMIPKPICGFIPIEIM